MNVKRNKYPPIFGFRPYGASRVSEVRTLRELNWKDPVVVPKKRSSKSTKPSKAIPGTENLSPQMQEMIRNAMKKLGM